MNETWILILAGVVGVLLGALFFGGLWWTVRKSVSSQRPALWFFGSFLLRMSLVLARILLGRGRSVGAVAGVSRGIYPGAPDRHAAHPNSAKAH